MTETAHTQFKGSLVPTNVLLLGTLIDKQCSIGLSTMYYCSIYIHCSSLLHDLGDTVNHHWTKEKEIMLVYTEFLP